MNSPTFGLVSGVASCWETIEPFKFLSMTIRQPGSSRRSTKYSSPRKKSAIPDPKPLLLASGLSSEEVSDLLQPYRIQDPEKADANLQSIAGDPQERQDLAILLKDLLSGVGDTADPDQALNNWDHYVQSGIHRGQLFQYLAQAPRMLHLLCTIFGNSPAMAHTLTRDPLLVYWLAEKSVLDRPPTRRHLDQQLRDSLATYNTAELKLEALRRFNRREMLRIGIRDLLRLATVSETVVALSELACVMIQAAYDLVDRALKKKHGSPMHRDRLRKERETGFVVLGMGKLGGGELNYSSDVDLVYLYESSHGETKAGKGQTKVSNEVYFEAVARDLTNVLSVATQEGMVFRVDLRLRPEGSVGSLTHSLDEAIRYYHSRGRDWERFAFLKACPVAGNKPLGQTFLRKIRPFIVGGGATSKHQVIETVRSLKTQIREKLVRRGEDDRHVKLGTGGIREIEFVVQTLQLLYTLKYPEVMERNTLTALTRLAEVPALSKETAKRLTQSYTFLRDIEHKLQMVEELQTHLIPQDLTEVAKCAVRLGYSKRQTVEETANIFLKDYRRHASAVHRIFKQIIG